MQGSPDSVILENSCLRNPGSWALESGKQLKESGILLGIVIPSSTDKKQSGFQTGIWNPWRGIQNPRLPRIPAVKSSYVFINTCQIRLSFLGEEPKKSRDRIEGWESSSPLLTGFPRRVFTFSPQKSLVFLWLVHWKVRYEMDRIEQLSTCF